MGILLTDNNDYNIVGTYFVFIKLIWRHNKESLISFNTWIKQSKALSTERRYRCIIFYLLWQ